MHKPHIHKANTIDLVWALGTIKNKTKQNKTKQNTPNVFNVYPEKPLHEACECSCQQAKLTKTMIQPDNGVYLHNTLHTTNLTAPMI